MDAASREPVGDDQVHASAPHLVWPALLERWTAAGQALLARLSALEVLAAHSPNDAPATFDTRSHDEVVDNYIDEFRRAWQDAKGSPGPAADRSAEPPSTAHDFVTHLVADPSDPPAAVLFLGFAGAAARAEHRRFYVDPTLVAFVEVPEEAVLHVVPVPAGQSPLGGEYVWVRRDTDIVHQLREAATETARVQQEIWGGEAAAQPGPAAMLTPFPDPTSLFSQVDGAAPDAVGFDAGDEENIPLPAGWPT